MSALASQPTPPTPPASSPVHENAPAEPIALTDVPAESWKRILTGFPSFDRVLGGGLVVGSIVLLGGPPGCGKTTLITQTAARVDAPSVLYASGEESPGQIADRARRVGAVSPKVQLLHESNIERVIAHARRLAVPFLIIDSVGTLTSEHASGGAGSVSQIKHCVERLAYFSHATGTTVILIGHITKDGGLAGPKFLEHLVDAVFMIEPPNGADASETAYRLLRAVGKNRFGATTERAGFEMTGEGLIESYEFVSWEVAESLVPVAQEILNRYRAQGGIVDDGLRDRIAGRLNCDEDIGP